MIKENIPQPGEIYDHKKGGRYVVISANNSVFYFRLGDFSTIFYRNLDNFNSEVGGIKRFTLVNGLSVKSEILKELEKRANRYAYME